MQIIIRRDRKLLHKDGEKRGVLFNFTKQQTSHPSTLDSTTLYHLDDYLCPIEGLQNPLRYIPAYYAAGVPAKFGTVHYLCLLFVRKALILFMTCF